MRGLRDQLAARIENRAGKIVPLLDIGRKAVWPSTTPISSAIAARRLFITASVTGSSFIARLQMQVAEIVDAQREFRRDVGGGAQLDDDGRSAHARARAE